MLEIAGDSNESEEKKLANNNLGFMGLSSEAVSEKFEQYGQNNRSWLES